ncbi:MULTISPECIES: hypothetical protein [Flavobacterium]|uniref:hypothetical protein n=1 Tax=Flavobacterium TaxID=237 RepID=UPI001FCAC3BF|nr:MULTISPECIES: hypothetical protein [Flavobacterium]UOK41561.1 hypothetical protein LZF87_09565 [Flavobacterium enshiense]
MKSILVIIGFFFCIVMLNAQDEPNKKYNGRCEFRWDDRANFHKGKVPDLIDEPLHTISFPLSTISMRFNIKRSNKT